jgi:RNA polymerase sigma-70 factor (sigma-E family)
VEEIGGDEFQHVWRQRREHLWKVAWLICGDADGADEIVAAAVARAWRGWDRRRVRDVDAYLRRAVVNEATDRFRRRRRDRRWAERRTGEGRGRRDLEDHVADHAELAAALARLPIGQRSVVVLRYWSDLTEAATAEALGVSIGTVKSRAARALRALAEVLQDTAVGSARRERFDG